MSNDGGRKGGREGPQHRCYKIARVIKASDNTEMDALVASACFHDSWKWLFLHSEPLGPPLRTHPPSSSRPSDQKSLQRSAFILVSLDLLRCSLPPFPRFGCRSRLRRRRRQGQAWVSVRSHRCWCQVPLLAAFVLGAFPVLQRALLTSAASKARSL